MRLRTKLLGGKELPAPVTPLTWEGAGHPTADDIEELPVRQREFAHARRFPHRLPITQIELPTRIPKAPVLFTAEGSIGIYSDPDVGLGRD